MTKDIRDQLSDVCEDVLFLDPPKVFDPAIVGVCHRAGGETFVLYDREKVIDQLVADGAGTREDAEEFFEFNTAGAYVGPHTPAFLIRSNDDA